MKLLNNISMDTLHQSFVEQGFDYHQAELLVKSINEGMSIELFGNTNFSYEKMRAIRDGVDLGCDMRPFANETSTRQKIRYAIEEHIFSKNHNLSKDLINSYLEYLDRIGE